jgi:glutaredoxin
MADHDVYLYALSTCPWCRKTKRFFEERSVRFSYVDVDTLPEDEGERVAEEAATKGGTRAFPVTLIDGQVTVGYDPGRFAELLGVQE